MLLNEQIELPHFHFNEALLKPFENLLCLELCDSDVQVYFLILCTINVFWGYYMNDFHISGTNYILYL